MGPLLPEALDACVCSASWVLAIIGGLSPNSREVVLGLCQHQCFQRSFAFETPKQIRERGGNDDAMQGVHSNHISSNDGFWDKPRMLSSSHQGCRENWSPHVAKRIQKPGFPAHPRAPAPRLFWLNVLSEMLSDHLEFRSERDKENWRGHFAFNILHFVLMCVLLRFSTILLEFLSEQVLLFGLAVSCFFALDCPSSGRTWKLSGFFWWVCVSALGLLQVRWSLKSTTSLNFALFWGGTLRFLLPPHLTFPHRFCLFSLFWLMIVLLFCFTWVIQVVQKGLLRPENSHYMDILWFLGASGFVFFSWCYALVHAIVLRLVFCVLLCRGGPSIFLWFADCLSSDVSHHLR